MYIDDQHIKILLISFLISLSITPLSIKLSNALSIVNNPNEERINHSSIPLLGSLSVGISFFIVSIYYVDLNRSIILILFFSLTNLIIGIIDDKIQMRSRLKFSIPLVLTIILVLSGIVIKFLPIYFLNVIVTITFIYGLINAYNFIDNMDGICTGVSLISGLAFGIFSIKTGQEDIAVISFALAGSASGFLIFNLPSAKIYLGDGGSLFFGSIISSIAVYGTWGNVGSNYSIDISFILVPLLLVGYPIYEVIYVFFNRLYHGCPPWKGDTNHTTHKLKKMGLSDFEVVFIVYLLTLSLSLLAFVVYDSTFIDSIIIFFCSITFFTSLTIILNKIEFEKKS